MTRILRFLSSDRYGFRDAAVMPSITIAGVRHRSYDLCFFLPNFSPAMPVFSRRDGDYDLVLCPTLSPGFCDDRLIELWLHSRTITSDFSTTSRLLSVIWIPYLVSCLFSGRYENVGTNDLFRLKYLVLIMPPHDGASHISTSDKS